MCHIITKAAQLTFFFFFFVLLFPFSPSFSSLLSPLSFAAQYVSMLVALQTDDIETISQRAKQALHDQVEQFPDLVYQSLADGASEAFRLLSHTTARDSDGFWRGHAEDKTEQILNASLRNVYFLIKSVLFIY